MPAVRKTVLDAMRAAMRDSTNGFNAQFAAKRASYQLDATELDWSEDSRTVYFGKVAPDALTGLSGRLMLRLSTGGTLWTGATKGGAWSGDVEGRLDFTVSYSYADNDADGIEDHDLIERWKGIVEDCAVEVFRAAETTLPDGVALARPADCRELPDAALGSDGWEQDIPISLVFRVDL